jgi:hypothetical protein
VRTTKCAPQSFKPAFAALASNLARITLNANESVTAAATANAVTDTYKRLAVVTTTITATTITDTLSCAALAVFRAAKTTTEYGFQVRVAQLDCPYRVLGEAEKFLGAQALAILFVFPCACDIEHFSAPFSIERYLRCACLSMAHKKRNIM